MGESGSAATNRRLSDRTRQLLRPVIG